MHISVWNSSAGTLEALRQTLVAPLRHHYESLAIVALALESEDPICTGFM